MKNGLVVAKYLAAAFLRPRLPGENQPLGFYQKYEIWRGFARTYCLDNTSACHKKGSAE